MFQTKEKLKYAYQNLLDETEVVLTSKHIILNIKKKIYPAWVLLILATQETEISRIAVSSQPRQTVCETLS
jgi:hypothetical protein